jgi:ketosteroid isomerase-like protein
MSQENVEIVRQTIDSINRGDIDGALENATDDFEADWSNSIAPGRQGTYSGKERVREFWRSFAEAFDELRWDPEEIIDVDESRVIVVNHLHARGRGSGAAVEGVSAQLWTIGDGKGRSVKLFQSKAEALEAVGLRG